MIVRHPAIFQLGKVTDDGTSIHIFGWSLGLCNIACHCHKHPTGGHLAINQNERDGELGLVCFRDSCTCCTPWTVDELKAILQDFQDIETIPTMDGERT